MFKILDLSNRDEWNRLIKKLPVEQQDIFYTPDYYSLYENYGDGKAQCFVFEKNDKIALYPFLINSINQLGYELDKEYFDIQGAYGYNGVVSNSDNANFLEEFKRSFTLWCKQMNVIAEFVRFNPITNNQLYSIWIEPVFLLDNVLIPLTTYEEVWNNSFHRKVREAVRKANRKELKYISFEGEIISDVFFNAFINIYDHMLKRNNADKSYYFSLDFFKQIKTISPHNTLFSFALLDKKPISTELILFGESNAYAFLGGTLSEYYSFSPNTFIQDEIVKDLLDRGIKFYNRGGGLQNGDTVYKFKKSFSISLESLFFIGKKIHNIDIYNNVIHQWEIKYPKSYKIYKNRLLGYRETANE